MKKFSFLIVLVWSSMLCFSQSNTGSFLVIRNYGINPPTYMLESDVYLRNSTQIQIDSTQVDKYGPCDVLFVSQGNKSIRKYVLNDSSGVILGKLKDSLKRVELRFGIRATLDFARLMADSLLKEKVYFFTEPSLSTPEAYELNFTGKINFKPIKEIDDFKDADAETKIRWYYSEFYNDFRSDFEYLGVDNIDIDVKKTGEVKVLVYLKDKNFDFKLLDKYQLVYSRKPYVRPRYYEIVVLEQQSR